MDLSRNFNSEESNNGIGYALSGKIMLSAIVVLFFIVVLMFSLHIYARWYLLRARRRQSRGRANNIVFHPDNTSTTTTRGLDARVLNSLPIFTFSSKTCSLECAVCLSELEENESGRVLPKCNHSFHVECIDMWFHSHSTCPLCRAPVEEFDPTTTTTTENPIDVVMTVPEPESASISTPGVCSRAKLSVEVPIRNKGEFDSETSSTSRSLSFRSPMTRMLSFKRILSLGRERWQSPCPTPRTVEEAVNESDLERGESEIQS